MQVTNNVKTKAGTLDTVVRYDGLNDLVRDVKANMSMREDGQFYGGTTEEAIEKAATGATEKELKSTRELLAKVDAALRGREAPLWQSSVAGAYPCVPDYLNGMPENMRARVMTESDRAPVRLFVEVVVSAGISVETLRKRGAALAALAMRLSEERPVELHLLWGCRAGGKQVVGTVQVGTAPVSAAEIAFMTADPKCIRNLAFVSIYAHTAKTNTGFIDWALGTPTDKTRNEAIREALGCSEKDVFLPGGYLSEKDEMFTDPVAWVNKYLNAQREVD